MADEIIEFVLKAGVIIASILILVRTEPALARMTRYTHRSVRFAVWLLAIGALARVVDIVVFGHAPDFITFLMMCGSAALLICERRLRVLTGGKRRYADDSVGVISK
jgi:Na+-translocating ferredoxin:NAD+ oxidoreductase RnfE subunit